MADGDHERPDAHVAGIAEGRRGEPGTRHSQEREVRVVIGAQHVRLDLASIGEPDPNARVAGDMSIRHDEVGRPQDARTAAGRTVDLHGDLPEPLAHLG